jgi:hypothetical protein
MTGAYRRTGRDVNSFSARRFLSGALRLLELARVLVRFDHIASNIVNADQRIM